MEETFTADDLTAFKQAFRRHAAGVAVITARDTDGAPVGFTATSLASLAAVPPLASFNMSRTSTAWHAVDTTDRVAIHMLGSRNRSIAERLSGPAAERFVGDHWRAGPHGLPILTGVTAWMTATILQRIPVAGNAIVVVHVEEGALGEDDAPLLYHERAYHAPRPLD